MLFIYKYSSIINENCMSYFLNLLLLSLYGIRRPSSTSLEIILINHYSSHQSSMASDKTNVVIIRSTNTIFKMFYTQKLCPKFFYSLISTRNPFNTCWCLLSSYSPMMSFQFLMSFNFIFLSQYSLIISFQFILPIMMMMHVRYHPYEFYLLSIFIFNFF